jgi:hypothetical protein
MKYQQIHTLFLTWRPASLTPDGTFTSLPFGRASCTELTASLSELVKPLFSVLPLGLAVFGLPVFDAACHFWPQRLGLVMLLAALSAAWLACNQWCSVR